VAPTGPVWDVRVVSRKDPPLELGDWRHEKQMSYCTARYQSMINPQVLREGAFQPDVGRRVARKATALEWARRI
jgi:hypothetical protein